MARVESRSSQEQRLDLTINTPARRPVTEPKVKGRLRGFALIAVLALLTLLAVKIEFKNPGLE